jgi:hypothetical protein
MRICLLATLLFVTIGLAGTLGCDGGGDGHEAAPADVPQFTAAEVLGSFESYLTGIAGSSGRVYLAQQMTDGCRCSYVGGHIWSVSCGTTVAGGEFRFYERTFAVEAVDQTAKTTIMMLRGSD